MNDTTPPLLVTPRETYSMFRDITLAVRVAIGRKRAQALFRVVEIARGSAPVHQKLTAIERTGLLRPDVSARELAELLGVSGTAIKKTQWRRNRMAEPRQAKADSMEAVKHAEPLVLGRREAARMLGITLQSLWNLTYPRGPIPCLRLGTGKKRVVLYPIKTLKNWLAAEMQHQCGIDITEKTIE